MEAARHLDKLRNEGLMRHIGLTNFDTLHMSRILDAGVPIVSNQVQFSLLDRRCEAEGMLVFCKKYNIKLLCYGSQIL